MNIPSASEAVIKATLVKTKKLEVKNLEINAALDLLAEKVSQAINETLPHNGSYTIIVPKVQVKRHFDEVTRLFADAMKKGGWNLICEVKRKGFKKFLYFTFKPLETHSEKEKAAVASESTPVSNKKTRKSQTPERTRESREGSRSGSSGRTKVDSPVVMPYADPTHALIASYGNMQPQLVNQGAFPHYAASAVGTPYYAQSEIHLDPVRRRGRGTKSTTGTSTPSSGNSSDPRDNSLYKRSLLGGQ